MKLLLIALVLIALTGCSALITSKAGSDGTILRRGATEKEIYGVYGSPMETPPSWVSEKLNPKITAYCPEWHVWKIYGHFRDSSAVGTGYLAMFTLGASEFIALPTVLVSEGIQKGIPMYVLVYFDPSNRAFYSEVYDGSGERKA